MEFIRIQSLITLISHIFFVGISFWSLQSLRMNHLFKKYKTQEIRALYIIVSIVLGYNLSSFFLEFLTYSQNLIYFFQ